MNLNRCPCGAEARVTEPRIGEHYVYCVDCDMKQMYPFSLQTNAIAAWNAWTSRIAANQWQRVTDTEPGDGENVVVAEADGIFAPTGYRVGGEWFHVGIEGAPKFFFRVPPCPDELKGEQ